MQKKKSTKRKPALKTKRPKEAAPQLGNDIARCVLNAVQAATKSPTDAWEVLWPPQRLHTQYGTTEEVINALSNCRTLPFNVYRKGSAIGGFSRSQMVWQQPTDTTEKTGKVLPSEVRAACDNHSDDEMSSRMRTAFGQLSALRETPDEQGQRMAEQGAEKWRAHILAICKSMSGKPVNEETKAETLGKIKEAIDTFCVCDTAQPGSDQSFLHSIGRQQFEPKRESEKPKLADFANLEDAVDFQLKQSGVTMTDMSVYAGRLSGLDMFSIAQRAGADFPVLAGQSRKDVSDYLARKVDQHNKESVAKMCDAALPCDIQHVKREREKCQYDQKAAIARFEQREAQLKSGKMWNQPGSLGGGLGGGPGGAIYVGRCVPKSTTLATHGLCNPTSVEIKALVDKINRSNEAKAERGREVWQAGAEAGMRVAVRCHDAREQNNNLDSDKLVDDEVEASMKYGRDGEAHKWLEGFDAGIDTIVKCVETMKRNNWLSRAHTTANDTLRKARESVIPGSKPDEKCTTGTFNTDAGAQLAKLSQERQLQDRVEAGHAANVAAFARGYPTLQGTLEGIQLPGANAVSACSGIGAGVDISSAYANGSLAPRKGDVYKREAPQTLEALIAQTAYEREKTKARPLGELDALKYSPAEKEQAVEKSGPSDKLAYELSLLDSETRLLANELHELVNRLAPLLIQEVELCKENGDCEGKRIPPFYLTDRLNQASSDLRGLRNRLERVGVRLVLPKAS